MRTGIGFDTHRLVEGRKLILGGVTIPHTLGLLGHSDADVLTHAIIDALLGAIAAGDIGQHFPDTDPQWKDANSLHLLEKAMAILNAQGYRLINIDATVLAEQPKLMPFLPAIREQLAHTLKIEIGALSIKATTVEGLGAIGRREGISAMAVATVDNEQSPATP
ncbi:MAG: 2-C-methyl-D-erythritol 2,4-cyclodiphosphate synthase [Kiritimatiellia bacterium]